MNRVPPGTENVGATGLGDEPYVRNMPAELPKRSSPPAKQGDRGLRESRWNS